jgi:hypothetical protein
MVIKSTVFGIDSLNIMTAVCLLVIVAKPRGLGVSREGLSVKY